jgi:hypothetical protein
MFVGISDGPPSSLGGTCQSAPAHLSHAFYSKRNLIAPESVRPGALESSLPAIRAHAFSVRQPDQAAAQDRVANSKKLGNARAKKLRPHRSCGGTQIVPFGINPIAPYHG